MPRYTRDEICSQGVEFAHSPTVSAHDTPGGILQPNAWSIKWLQNALDYFHTKFPFASDIQTVSLTIRAGITDAVLTSDNTKYLPTDFILDVRSGVDVYVDGRFFPIPRKDYRTWRIYNQSSQQVTTRRPEMYSIINKRIKVLPLVTESLQATLHYYALPPVLKEDEYPNFPDEWILIEFIQLKAKEWTRMQGIEPGTAQFYLAKQLAGLRASGLLNEPEHENGIPIENNQIVLEGQFNRNAWMGPISP